MFTFEKLLDFYSTQTKSVLNYVQPESVRTQLVNLTDVQVSFAKSLHEQTQAAVDYVSKQMQEAAKTDWSKFFVTAK